MLFHAVSVALLLNTSPQYHVVFDNTLYAVDHTRKGTVPGNWKPVRGSLRDYYTGKLYSLQKSGILTNLQECHYPGRTDKKI